MSSPSDKAFPPNDDTTPAATLVLLLRHCLLFTRQGDTTLQILVWSWTSVPGLQPRDEAVHCRLTTSDTCNYRAYTARTVYCGVTAYSFPATIQQLVAAVLLCQAPPSLPAAIQQNNSKQSTLVSINRTAKQTDSPIAALLHIRGCHSGYIRPISSLETPP